MNKHIALVKKWIADTASVTQQELDDNLTAATKQYYDYAANATYAAAFYAAFYAANSAYYTANTVYADTDSYAAYYVKYWVKQYEESKEQGE